MNKKKEYRIQILITIPIVWLMFCMFTDYYRTLNGENQGTAESWDRSDLKIAGQNEAQEESLRAVFELKGIPINSAGEELLTTIPGIGPELARRIVEQRQQSGRYLTSADLTRVAGIGPRRVEQFKAHLSFD